MSENTNAGRAHDPVRDKYVHAVSWDYTSRDPQVARLRERLAAEYDGRPAIPAGMDAGRFMDSLCFVKFLWAVSAFLLVRLSGCF